KRERIDLKAVRKRHGGVAALPQPHSLARPSPVRIRRRRKPPEIVEADLRRRKAGKLRTRSRVQIPQPPIANPVARQRAQLLLDQLERPPNRRSAPKSRLNINPAHIQPHRIETGEPAHRARKIDIPRHLLAPVTLHINQHRSAGATTAAPTPLHNGQRQPGEQHMLDAAMERRRHPRQQPLRDRSRQRQRQPTRRANRGAPHQPPPARPHAPPPPRPKPRNPTPHPPPATPAIATTDETRSPAPAAPAQSRPQSPPTPPQAQAPGCATTPRQPQDDGWSAADAPNAALRRQTTPPAPALPPPAQARSPPLAHAPRCTPHAPQHQAPQRHCVITPQLDQL